MKQNGDGRIDGQPDDVFLGRQWRALKACRQDTRHSRD